MNIVHVITDLGDGGAESVLYRLCLNDPANRHTVVSLRDKDKYGPLLEKAGIRVYCLEMRRGRLSMLGLYRLWRLLRSQKPDIVQTWMYHADLVGGIVARLAGIRHIFWGIRRTSLKRGQARRSTILVARLCALLSRWVPTGIVCCAGRAMEEHRDFGYAADIFHVIPNGYDVEILRPDPGARNRLRAEWRINATTPLLGMIGRFDQNKDHENLLHALSILKRTGHTFQCILIGREIDNENRQLKDWLFHYDLRQEVRLLGQRNDIPAVMSALDVHVLSSGAEAFPNVLAEAMACGTPCVTTDVGDAALILGVTGWLAPPGDPPALAEAIRSALIARKYTESWRKRQMQARLHIENNFSIKRMVTDYNELWRRDNEYKVFS